MKYYLFVISITLFLAGSLAENNEDLIGFKECQKHFGFSKKLEKSFNAEEEAGDISNKDQQLATTQSQSTIEKELSVFYHCLNELSTCSELILSSEEEDNTQKKQIPFQECFSRCYNPNEFSTNFMKELTKFSLNCAKSTLHLKVIFKSKDEFGSYQGRIPWEIVGFGAVLSSFFVAWVNLKQVRLRLRIMKEQQNSQVKSIYELNPDYLAQTEFQNQRKQQNGFGISSLKDEENQEQPYQSNNFAQDKQIKNEDPLKIINQITSETNRNESYNQVCNQNCKTNEEKGLLCGHEENMYSDNEDYIGVSEDPFDL